MFQLGQLPGELGLVVTLQRLQLAVDLVDASLRLRVGHVSLMLGRERLQALTAAIQASGDGLCCGADGVRAVADAIGRRLRRVTAA